MSDDRLGQWGFASFGGAFVARVADVPRLKIERPEGWTDEEWDEFVREMTDLYSPPVVEDL